MQDWHEVRENEPLSPEIELELGGGTDGLGRIIPIDVGSLIAGKRDGHETIIRDHPLELQDVLNGHVGIGRRPVLPR